MGRKRKRGTRHTCGKLVQCSPERTKDVVSVAIEARQRALGLSAAMAGRTEAETALGLAYLKNELAPNDAVHNRHLFLAGEEYRKVRAENAIAMASRAGAPSASDYDRTHGYDGSEGDDPEYVERCNHARRRFAESRRALLEADPFALNAADAWIVDDTAAWKLMGDLRLALNALARLYRVDEWERAKNAA